MRSCTSALINKQDNDGNNLLIAAVKAGKMDLALKLVQRGANLYLADKVGKTALMYMIEKAPGLIEVMMDTSQKSIINNVKWFRSAAEGNVDLIKTMLADEYPIETRSIGNTDNDALIVASKNGRLNVVKLLLEFGIPERFNIKGENAFFTAARYGHLEILKILHNSGFENKSNKNGTTPLMKSVKYKHHGATDYLLKIGSDFEKSNSKNKDAAVYSIVNDNQAALKLLIENGLNFGGKRRLFLHHAIGLKLLDIVIMLVESGMSVNFEDHCGNTPIFLSLNNVDILKYLVKNGAIVDHKNDMGLTIMDIATEKNLHEVVDFLNDFVSSE